MIDKPGINSVSPDNWYNLYIKHQTNKWVEGMSISYTFKSEKAKFNKETILEQYRRKIKRLILKVVIYQLTFTFHSMNKSSL